MKHVGLVVTGMAVVAVTATLVVASEGKIDRESVAQSATDFRWSEDMAAGDLLEIKGVNGDISVSLAQGSDVVVTAESRGRKSDPSTVRIEVVEHSGGVTLCAVYPDRRGERENYCGVGEDGRMNTRDNDVQVDFHVELPRGVDFAGRTVNGEVDARDLESDLVAVTVNGDINVSTTGFAEAETVNGSIDARMDARDLGRGAKFATVNGSITVDVADDIDADIDASWLNGGFESDLPVMLEGRMSRRSANGRLGDGGPELELSTVNGSIRIR